jgi:hypothetical protein
MKMKKPIDEKLQNVGVGFYKFGRVAFIVGIISLIVGGICFLCHSYFQVFVAFLSIGGLGVVVGAILYLNGLLLAGIGKIAENTGRIK